MFPRKKIKWSSNKTLEFLAIDWIECDEPIYDNDEKDEDYDEQFDKLHNKFYTIFLFGVTIEGYSVCVKIKNYLPYFYVKIPNLFIKKESLKDKFDTEFIFKNNLNFNKINRYDGINKKDDEKSKQLSKLRDKLEYREHKSALLCDKTIEVKKEIFWSFTNNTKYDFYKFYFQSKEGYHLYNNFLKLNTHFPHIINKNNNKKPYNIKCKLFESELEPLLRFFHDMKIKPSGWIKINKYSMKPGMSSCQINVEIDYKDIIPIEKDIIPPLIVASFDIEADSSHGDFPLAKKDYKKLANQLVVSYLNKKVKLNKLSSISIEYKSINKEINNLNFFKSRIIQAFDINNEFYSNNNKIKNLNQIDSEISKVYYKKKNIKSSKDNKLKIKELLAKEEFNLLCKECLFICNRPIKKVVANKHMKDAIKEVNIKYQKKEDYYFNKDRNNPKFCNINDLISIIKTVSKKTKISFELLKTKILVKDILVKFINYELKKYFPEVKGDKVIQIGTSFWQYGDDKPIYNNMITLKNTTNIDGIDIYNYDSEKRVLLEWTNMIKHYDPDIVLGYNTFGFDEVFMYDRANELIAKGDQSYKNKEYQNFMNMGRLNLQTYKNIWNCKGKLLKKKLVSSALGANYLEYFNMPGRVQIDLLKSIQGGLEKLSSYKLDSVAEHYISGDIIKVGRGDRYDAIDAIDADEDDMTNYLEIKNIKELEVGNYIIITLISGEKISDGKKFIIESIDIEKNVIILKDKIPLSINNTSAKWGISKDDVTPKQIFEFQKGTDEQRAIIAKYCIQDCALVVRLLKKLDTIVNNFGMSNVCLVPFSYIFMRGQGIKIFSLIVNECALNEFVLPTLDKVYSDEIELTNTNSTEKTNLIDIINNDEKRDNGFELNDNFNKIIINNDGYEGAIVLVPKPGIYFEPITVLDFSSLYPSEMIASNISLDSHCEDEYWLGDKGAERIRALGYDFIDRPYDLYTLIDPKNPNKGKKKTGVKVERLVQYPDGRKGLIPTIEMKLLGARKATKNLIKKETDPFKISILDGLQLAYKVTANSLYGQLGASTSKIFKKALAAATTAGGRECIYRAKDYCLKNNPGCKVVYGDSIPSYELIHVQINGKVITNTIHHIKQYYFKLNNDDSNGKNYYLPLEKYKGKILTFTDSGLTPVLNIMEHYSKNDIIKIITKAGTVHVTDEHSLILENGDVIKPKDLKMTDILLTHNYNYRNKFSTTNIIKNQIYNGQNKEIKQIKQNRGKIIDIINLGPTKEKVYDLTTENHHFQAGLGRLVVHNTDSVFVKFNLVYPDGSYPKTDVEKVQRSIDIGLELQAKLKKDKFFKPPHDLEYEKVFYPLMLITKKRYAGKKFLFNPNKSEFTSMGIVIKRRDNAPILKHTYRGVMDEIMEEKSIAKGIAFVKLCCQEIIDDKYDLNMFVISKTLSDYYKDPESIPHKVLANRMIERDPGNKPASNERIPYAYIKVKEKPGVKLLQGDRIEHVNYIKEHNLQLDYYIYIKNQLLKPISQIFELVVEKMDGFPYHKDHFNNLYDVYFDKYKGDKKKTDKKISELKQKVVAKLIFEKYMVKATNKQNNVTTLDKWFTIQEQPKQTSIFNNNNNDNKNLKQTRQEKPIKKPRKQMDISAFFG